MQDIRATQMIIVHKGYIYIYIYFIFLSTKSVPAFNVKLWNTAAYLLLLWLVSSLLLSYFRRQAFSKCFNSASCLYEAGHRHRPRKDRPLQPVPDWSHATAILGLLTPARSNALITCCLFSLCSTRRALGSVFGSAQLRVRETNTLNTQVCGACTMVASRWLQGAQR